MTDPQTVLVTGGAGFIGTHTVDLLLERGHRVVVLDDLSTGHLENLPPAHDRLRYVEGDVSEPLAPRLDEVSAQWGAPDRVIHLAAQTSVTRSIERPLFDVRVNYCGTVNVVEYARWAGAKKIIFASSAAVYGDVRTLPVSEDSPCLPLSPYGADKLASEHYIRYCSAVHGLPTTALRFFNVYGPRQDPKSPYSGVISIFLDRATRGEPLRIFGDGDQTRDFVHVSDVVAAIVGAAFGGPSDGRAINIGTGSPTSVLDLARSILRSAERATDAIEHAPRRGGEIQHSLANVSRARTDLGLAARVGIEEGLQHTARWFLQNR